MELPAAFTVRTGFVVSIAACVALVSLLASSNPAKPAGKTLIAHRGASA